MLEVINVKKNYGELTAVKKLSFEIRPGEVFGLLGTNGAGKTTTFKMILGLLEPTEGEILFNGKKVSYDDVDQIGYMIEERSLLVKLTVKQLMLHYGQLKGLDKDTILKRLDYWLDRFNVKNYLDKKISELSKGNQQKIQFISSIINNPKLLVLDEPFSGLDPLNTNKFVEVIRDFQKKGTMIIFSTHQIDHVESFCEQLIVLEKGNAVLSGKISDIKKDFKRHNIKMIGDFDKDTLLTLPGVLDVIIQPNEWIVKIEDEVYSNDIFDYVKTCSNVRKFDVEQATLSEIFIEKVGESFEQV
ncbi:ABC-type transport system, ATPase component [Paracholeplasma brassicae]|uniref:ABC-type transport system, ATPase component n=1 Tax=Acholeplasma brassicae TaxID=61635 RepID=U4KRE1_9MOLU|nr:ATP-binding cassette domain-containing protein [Paracholeplasma brassicae]CCV65668.1 ABC-type transport system, ATPase component [Paracholeplasma brassicae]